MKKRIIVFCTLLTFAALIISSVITLIAVQQRYLKEARVYLTGSMEVVMSNPVAADAYDALAHEKARELKDDVRITFVDLTGKVLGDSEADYKTMPNHAARPEIQGAIKDGTGEDVRHSETVGKDMLYVAKKFGNSVIARFSMPLSNEQIFVMDILPSIIVAVIVSLLAALAGVNLLMKRILKPFYDMQKVLSTILGGKFKRIPDSDYAEFAPVVDGLNEMVDKINSYIVSVKQQTEKIDNIIRNMQEGLVLLDENTHVLLSNDAASRLLGFESELMNKNFIHLVRNKDMSDALHLAINEKKPSIMDIKKRMQDMRTLRVFISPVQNGSGAIMFINDITEIKKAENVRREFTANVSHELKTPLTTIKGFAELMSEGMVKDEVTLNKYAMLIRIEVERLINLINDILRISELEETAIPVNIEQVDLLETARDVCELLADEAKKRNVQLNLHGESVVILASKDSMKELLLNLTDNAIKYNRENGSVDISISESRVNASIEVADTGIGIPEEHQGRIFERFYRVDKGRSKKTGGTGLGLSIVKHIVGLYQGEIKLKSEPGEGSKFEIIFPKYH